MPSADTPTGFMDAGDDSPARYTTQFYYREDFARELAEVMGNYLDRGRPATTWPLTIRNNEKSTRLMLNCARAYIIQNPHQFADEIVHLAERMRFAKRSGRIQLIEEVGVLRRSSETAAESITAAVEYSDVQNPLPSKLPHQLVIEPDNDADSQHMSIQDTVQSEQLPPAPTMHNYLPEDGDLETLLICIDNFIATGKQREAFERYDVRLTDATIDKIRAHLVPVTEQHALGIRLTPNKIVIVKT